MMRCNRRFFSSLLNGVATRNKVYVRLTSTKFTCTCTTNRLRWLTAAVGSTDDFLTNHRRPQRYRTTRPFSNRSSEHPPRSKNLLRSQKEQRTKHQYIVKPSGEQTQRTDRLKGRPPPTTASKDRQQHGLSEQKRIKAILLEIVEGISSLQQRVDNLSELPFVWSTEVVIDDPNRRHIFNTAKNIVKRIQACVKDGSLQPSGKHQHEVSVLLERILKIYSYVSMFSDESVFDECSSLLRIMEENWKIDLQNKHCEFAITAAAQEGRWKDAAELFSSRIDPDDSGYAPYDVAVANPVGLYAIARFAQERGTAVVENVLDAVLQLSMVSPSDQNKYILAAGTAIGHAGEWEAFVNYLQTSYNASQMGQTLVAAVMHACLLCHRHDEALQVYDNSITEDFAIAGEWQWGGGQDRLDPLCRDLAMRALGGSSACDARTRAFELYREAENDNKAVSLEALCGVVSTCERDGNWEDAISIFFSVLDKSYTSCWLDAGDDLVVSDMSSSVGFNTELIPRMGRFLDTVMLICNSADQFAVALLVFRMFELSLSRSYIIPDLYPVAKHSQSEISEALCQGIILYYNSDELLATTMVSLCGLSCPHEAVSLFEAVESLDEGNVFACARDLLEFSAREVAIRKPASFQPSWEASFRHMHKVTAAFQTMNENDHELKREDARLLASALSSSINAFTFSSQPEAGILLLRWVEGSDGGMNGAEGRIGFLPLTDSLLAAVVEAHSQCGRPDLGLEVFQSHVGSNTLFSNRLLSSIAAMRALFSQGRHEDAMDLFQKVVRETRSPGLYCAAAKGLVQANELSAAADLYRQALSSGCVSEELSLLSLQAVRSTHGKGRIRVMRNIIEEVARTVGTSASRWTEAKYWELKRLVGFSNVSMLMWWNDPKTSHLDELDLALHVLHTRASSGLTPKNDALRLVVAAAKTFHPDYIPPERTGLPRLPRDSASWIKILTRVLDEAEFSTLSNDAKFIEDVALAFHALGHSDESVRIVSNALSRGVRVHLNTLTQAVNVAADAGAALSVDEIRMMISNHK